MHFLSIAGRELRVAARKRSTFRVRTLTSFIALVVTGHALWLVKLFASRPVSGAQLFLSLSWVTLVSACLVGPALTADSVNEERNEGTLGLLFLTHLNSASISLGKLIAHGVLAFYSILSIVPMLALAVLLGGADGTTLAKTTLVLCVTLFLSLTIGMFASTLWRNPWTATAASLIIVATLVLAIPLVDAILRLNPGINGPPRWDLLSPSYSLSMAGPAAALLPGNRLWQALISQLLLGGVFFGLVTFLLPRVWIEGKSGQYARAFHSARRALKYGSSATRLRLRRRLLRLNPILWLSARERFGPAGFAILLLVLAFAISWIGKHVRGPNGAFVTALVAWIWGAALLYFCFCLRLAAAASERFAADRKAGALELIVCTPLQTREIIRGHWLGLVRRFWGAATLLFALHAFALYYIVEASRIEGPVPGFSLQKIFPQAWQHLSATGFIPNEVAPFYVAVFAVLSAAVLMFVLWIALGWLGMALSLTLRREILAPWISLFLLAIPPVPVFIGSVALFDDKQFFVSNLFLGLLRVGATGFFIVLINALIWLSLARRWTYKKLRPGSSTCASPEAAPDKPATKK